MNADSITESPEPEAPDTQDLSNGLAMVGNQVAAEKRASAAEPSTAVVPPVSAPKSRQNSRPIASVESLQTKLAQAQADLKKEKEVHNRARDDLEKIIQELGEVGDQTRADLQKKDQELDQVRKLWKQAISELNRFLAQSQNFYQVTDQELIQKVTQLRFNIRNFAVQRSGGEVIEAKTIRSFWESTKEYLDISFDTFEAYMENPSQHPVVIRAYLWAFLAKEFFGQFRWANKSASKAMWQLADILGEPVGKESSTMGPEAKRKFQMWRANTSNLLIEAENLDEEDDHGARRTFNVRKIVEICNAIIPFSKSPYRDLEAHVSNIVSETLNLDKMISKQVAQISWSFDRGEEYQGSTADPIEQQRGGKRAHDGRDMELILAPGVIKWGKSNGEGFEVGNTLLDIEVWCEPRTVDRPQQSHKSSTGSIMHRAKDILNTRK